MVYEPTSDKKQNKFWNRLSVHSDCEKKHAELPAGVTKIWRDLIFAIEDQQPAEFLQLKEAMLAVPFETQESFAALSFLGGTINNSKTQESMSSGGSFYENSSGEQCLLVSQFYSHMPPDDVSRWAISKYGIEFGGGTASCLAISIDLMLSRPVLIEQFRREQLWPKLEDLDEWVAFTATNACPVTSHDVRDLIDAYMLRRTVTSDDIVHEPGKLLLALARNSGTAAANVLQKEGFDLQKAKEGFEALRHVPFQHWSIFQLASRMASSVQPEFTGSEFVLLALLLDKNCKPACDALKLINVDPASVRKELGKLICSNANGMLYKRFTKCSIRSMIFAEQESRAKQKGCVGSSELLVGLLRGDRGDGVPKLFRDAGESRSYMVFQNLEIEIDDVRAAIEQRPRMFVPPVLPMTRACQQILKDSAAIADQMNAEKIDTTHLLAALLKSVECKAHDVLYALNVESGVVNAQIERVQSESTEH